MTPQQKKLLSLARDRRNRYGENDKSSRKAIRKRKRLANRSGRHFSAGKLRNPPSDLDLISEESTIEKRKRWKKSPDKPLGHILQSDLLHKIERLAETSFSQDSVFFSRLENALRNSGWHPLDARETVRRLSAVVEHPYSGKFNLPLVKARSLLQAVQQARK